MAEAAVAKKEDGNSALRSGQTNEALKLYSEGIDLDPTNAALWCNRAFAYLKADQVTEAEHDARQSVRLDESNLKAHYRLALSQIGTGKTQMAAQSVERGVQLFPENTDFANLQRKVQALRSLEVQFGAVHEAVMMNQRAGNHRGAGDLLQDFFVKIPKFSQVVPPLQAEVLEAMATNFSFMLKFDVAEERYAQAIEILKASGPAQRASLSKAMGNLASLYGEGRSREKALPLLQEVLQFRKEVYGNAHVEVAKALNNLGEYYRQVDDYLNAKKCLLEAQALYSELCGKASDLYCQTTSVLARLNTRFRKFEEAEAMLLDCIASVRESRGADNKVVGHNLLILAETYMNWGRLTDAWRCGEESVAILRLVLPEDHPDIAQALHCVGQFYLDCAEYVKAEPFVRQSLRMRKQIFGEDSYPYAKSLSSLAGILFEMGDDAKALKYLEQAVKIQTKVSGETHPEVITSLNNLACQYCHDSDLREKGLRLFAHLNKLMSDCSPGATIEAHVYTLEGKALADVGLLDNARQCLTAALHRRQELGNPALVAEAFSNLGCLLSTPPVPLPDTEAISFSNSEGKSIRLQVEGGAINQYTDGKFQGAVREFHIDESAGSYTGCDEGLFGEDEDVQSIVTRRDSLMAVADFSRHEHVECDVCRACPIVGVRYKCLVCPNFDLCQQCIEKKDSVHDESHAFRAIPTVHAGVMDLETAEKCLAKAYSLNTSLYGEKHAITASTALHLSAVYGMLQKNEDAFGLLQQMTPVRSTLLNAVLQATAESRRFAYVQQVRLEMDLAISLAVAQSTPAFREFAFEVVLQRKGVVFETQKVERAEISFELRPQFDELNALRTQLASAVLGGSDSSDLANLHERIEEIESRLGGHCRSDMSLAKTQAALSEATVILEFVRYKHYEFSAGKVPGRSCHRYAVFVVQGGDASLELHDVGAAGDIDADINVFRKALGKTRRRAAGLRLVKALLSHVTLESLGHVFIGVDGEISRLPIKCLPDPKQPDNFLLDLDFTCSSITCARDLSLIDRDGHYELNDSIVICNPDFDLKEQLPQMTTVSQDWPRGLIDFHPLPETMLEGQSVLCALNRHAAAKLLQGRDASVGELRLVHSPRILHIATHGFFLPNQIEPTNRLERSLAKVENPLLRSGLALAGARAWQEGQEASQAPGIFTAQDARGLDLKGTRLVVLSACETGLGDTQCGQGVQGLASACLAAGARSVVMSLWKVPDAETRKLMEAFYDGLCSGKTTAHALQDAQRKLRQDSSMFAWGAMVIQGWAFDSPLDEPVSASLNH